MKYIVLVILVSLLFSCNNDGNNEINFTQYDLDIEEGNQIGKEMKDFILPDYNDKNVWFRNMRGKVILIKYWSPTCGICVKTMPETVELKNNYYSKGLRVVTISNYVNTDVWKSHIEELNMSSLINLFDISYLDDYNNSFASYFEVKAIPFYILLDKYGIIRYKGNSDQNDLIPIIEEFLAVP